MPLESKRKALQVGANGKDNLKELQEWMDKGYAVESVTGAASDEFIRWLVILVKEKN